MSIITRISYGGIYLSMKRNDKFAKRQAHGFDSIVNKASRKMNLYKTSYASQYEFDTLVSFMPNLAGSNVLDIGCGTGRFVRPLAKIAKYATGIDASKDSIDLLRKRAKQEGIRNISARVMDFQELTNNEQFDYVLIVNVLHHVQDMEKLLNKIHQILKRDSKLIIFEFNPLNPLFVPCMILADQLDVHLNKEYIRSNIWTIRKTLAKSHYSIATLGRYSFLPTLLYNVSPIFIKVNAFLNSIPLVNNFCAFHIIVCSKQVQYKSVSRR